MELKAGTTIAEFDPHNTPMLAEKEGYIKFEDVIEGETLRKEHDAGGSERWQVIEHKGDLHPQIIIADKTGKILDVSYIPERAYIEVREGQLIKPGALLAKTVRETGSTQDIVGGLPRVTEIFEARRPKEPAVIAEIDGVCEVSPEKKRGKRTVIVKNPDTGVEREHLVPTSKQLRVNGGDFIRAGEALCEGPQVSARYSPHQTR